MTATIPTVEEMVFLPKWGCRLTILFTPDGPYCLLRQLCRVVGVEDVRQQFEQLVKRQATHDYTTKFPVQTPTRGKQVTYCIHIDILAWWLAGLNEKLIRPEFAPRLVRFQKDIVRAARELLFGTPHEDAAPEEVAKGKIIRLQDWLGPSVHPIDTTLPDMTGDDEG
jgi:P22_AR N-terminal domain